MLHASSLTYSTEPIQHVPTTPLNNSSNQTSQVARELSKKLGERSYAMWFKDSRIRVQDGHLEIMAQTRFAADWIRRRFGDDLRDIAGKCISPESNILVIVDTEAANKEENQGTRDTPTTRPQAPDRTRGSRPSAPARTRFHELNRFVVGDCNRLAWTAASRLAEEGDHSALSPLFIHGGCGLGKTHILQGLCRRVMELDRGRSRTRYVTGEQFTNEYITAVRQGTLDRFRAAYRGLSLLAIDDVHFISGKKKTQAEFQHTLEAIELTGARLALASTDHPGSTSVPFTRNLVSRFLSGLVVQLERPCNETRLELVHRFAADRSLRLNEAAARLVASKCLGSGREIQGALTRLKAMQIVDPVHSPSDDPEQMFMPGFNESQDRSIGPVAVKRVFASNQWAPEAPVPVSTVVECVSLRTGVSRSELAGPSRHQRITIARSLVAHLARSLTTASYPEIARAMGRRNHSSMHAAAHRIATLLDHDPLIELQSPGGEVEQIDLMSLLDELRRDIKSHSRNKGRSTV